MNQANSFEFIWIQLSLVSLTIFQLKVAQYGLGGMWRTEENFKKVEDCKKELESLRSDLYGDAIGTLIRKSGNTRYKGAHFSINQCQLN